MIVDVDLFHYNDFMYRLECSGQGYYQVIHAMAFTYTALNYQFNKVALGRLLKLEVSELVVNRAEVLKVNVSDFFNRLLLDYLLQTKEIFDSPYYQRYFDFFKTGDIYVKTCLL